MNNPKFLAAQAAKAAAKEEIKGGEGKVEKQAIPVPVVAVPAEEVKQAEVKPAK